MTSRPAPSLRAESTLPSSPAPTSPATTSSGQGGPARSVPSGEHREWIINELRERLGPERAQRDLPLGVPTATSPGLGTPTPTVVQVTVSSAGVRDVLQRRYGLLLDELASACGRAVQWSVVEAGEPGAPSLSPEGGPHAGRGASGGVHGRATPLHAPAHQPEPSLASTVVGACNRLAVDGLTRVLTGQLPAGVPVYLHGSCGVGKTHLLRAVVHDWAVHRLGSQARCMTAEQFANEFGGAVRSQRVDGFRKRLRGVDLLCIDDLQSLAGKEGMQAELVHTLDALLSRRASVVVAAAAAPRRLGGISDALASRLAGGLVAEVQGPDTSTATKLVMVFAARRGLMIDEPVARAIATGVASAGHRHGTGRSSSAGGAQSGVGGLSVRDLEGAVTKVEAVHRLLDTTLAGGRVNGSAVARLETSGARDGGANADPSAGSGDRLGAEVVTPQRGGGSSRVGLIAVRRALGHDDAGAGRGDGRWGGDGPDGLEQSAADRWGAGQTMGQGKAIGTGAGLQRGAGSRRPLTPAQVVTCVCERLGVTHAELAGRGRHQRVVLARAMATAVSRRLTSGSYPEIARAIGRPNHSTVITAHQRLNELMSQGEHTDDSGSRVALSALLEELCQLAQSHEGPSGRASALAG